MISAASSAAQEINAFAAASAAFEAGDYREALHLFQAAQASGVDTPALNYNLGVCQYRVGDYAAAAATFEGVRERFLPLAAIADYNRGLALLALDRTRDARTAFERARADGDATLRELAGRALATLEPATTPRSRWLGYFDVTAGHDDNVALVDELSLPATVSASSAFTELVGYAGGRVGERVPLRLSVSGYAVRYSDAHAFDQEVLRVDTAFESTPGDWRFEVGPHVAETLLDGDGFERAVGVAARATRPINARVAFELRVVYDDIDAPSSRFAFIAGTRARLRIGFDSRIERGRLRLGYDIEENDRIAASVSPSRNRLTINYQHQVGTRWSLEGTAAYRQSAYDDLLAPRDERLWELGSTARRSLGGGWSVAIEYRLADNDSNIDEFSYRSHRTGVAIGKSF